MPGGFGSPMNRCTNFDSANDFIIVIFPGNVNFLLDHVNNIFHFLLYASSIFVPYVEDLSSESYT